MSQTNDLQPPIDSTVEIETVTFDFGLILQSGNAILQGTPTVTCNLVSGTDPDPASRLQSDPMIVASPNSGAAASAVSLLVGSMIGGTIYRLQCWCATSDGQTLSLWTHLMCRTPN